MCRRARWRTETQGRIKQRTKEEGSGRLPFVEEAPSLLLPDINPERASWRPIAEGEAGKQRETPAGGSRQRKLDKRLVCRACRCIRCVGMLGYVMAPVLADEERATCCNNPAAAEGTHEVETCVASKSTPARWEGPLDYTMLALTGAIVGAECTPTPAHTASCPRCQHSFWMRGGRRLECVALFLLRGRLSLWGTRLLPTYIPAGAASGRDGTIYRREGRCIPMSVLLACVSRRVSDFVYVSLMTDRRPIDYAKYSHAVHAPRTVLV